MGIREILAFNMRRRRNELGISQEDLADSASLDRTYISSLERCRYGATIDVVAKLALALGVDPIDLLRSPPT
jgi:transcriptional regulator with XRE-family HTH domain